MKKKFEFFESSKELSADRIEAKDVAPLQEKNLLELGQKLKSGFYKVSEHIPFLKPEILHQLRFIQSHLTTQEQRSLFPIFQKEFEQREENQTVTYEWWILFAYRLSILVTPYSQRQVWRIGRPLVVDPFTQKILEENTWHNHEDLLGLMRERDTSLYKLIARFPEVILIPSTKGDFEISDFNNCLVGNIMPLGLSGAELIADGMTFQPNMFFRHDITHAGNWFGYESYEYPCFQLFLKYTLHKIAEKKDVRQKSQLEFMLFNFTHEEIGFIDQIGASSDLSTLKSFKVRVLRGNNDGNLYKLCLMDSWYATLIKPYLPKDGDQETETKLYIDESITLIENHILQFFQFFKMDHFSGSLCTSHFFNYDRLFNDFKSGAASESAPFDLRNFCDQSDDRKSLLHRDIDEREPLYVYLSLQLPANVTYLDLSWNKQGFDIESIYKVLMAIPKHVTKIDISFNELEKLPIDYLDDLNNEHSQIDEVFLSFNEFDLMTQEQREAFIAIFPNIKKIGLINAEGRELENLIFSSEATASIEMIQNSTKHRFFKRDKSIQPPRNELGQERKPIDFALI